jgi:hypothetical protein
VAKLRLNEKRCQLSFTRPEDLRLFAWMEQQAFAARYDLPTFVIVSLQQAFAGQVPEDEQAEALAEEAIRRIQERASAPPEVPPQVQHTPELPAAEPLTDEEAYRQGQEYVAKMNALAPQVFRKKRGGGKGPAAPPPLPE